MKEWEGAAVHLGDFGAGRGSCLSLSSAVHRRSGGAIEGGGIRGVPPGVKLSAGGRHPPYTVQRYVLHGIIPVGVTLAPPLPIKPSKRRLL